MTDSECPLCRGTGTVEVEPTHIDGEENLVQCFESCPNGCRSFRVPGMPTLPVPYVLLPGETTGLTMPIERRAGRAVAAAIPDWRGLDGPSSLRRITKAVTNP
jgi:hypothetical protein